MIGYYDYRLALLSFIVGMTTSLATLIVASKIYRSKSELTHYWLLSGAVTVGFGIWATFFIGMLAYRLTIPVSYSSTFLLLSWGIAIASAGVSLKVVSIATLKKSQFISSILAMTSGLVLAPYAGINAMEVVPTLTFDSLLVMMTMVIALSAAAVMVSALHWLRLKYFEVKLIPNIGAAIFITSCMMAIEYCSMASTVFSPNSRNVNPYVVDHQLLAVLVALGAMGLVIASFVSIVFYFKVGQNKLTMQLNEEDQASLSKLAMVDTLTQLPNRRYFQHHLEIATHRIQRNNSSLAVAFIDLDGFKGINDVYGHNIGDKLLVAVANRLSMAVRGCDMVARLGGDEFVALLEEVKSDDEITPIIERMIEAVNESFNIDQQEITISASIGIAIAPRDGDMATLMIRADTAMYRAKSDGKNQYRFYDAAIEFASTQLAEMQQDLKQALMRHEFKLYFQPKINSLTREITGLETLIRWQHPTKGDIPPHAFLAAAEHFGLMAKIGDWVIEETCRTIHRMRNQGIHLPIAINLAAQQFRNKQLVKNIVRTLKRFDIPTHSLMFEINESTAIHNAALVNHLLGEFQVAGFSVAMDDFGTGQSSLVYLQSVQVNELKLDRTFTKHINQDKQAQAVVGAMVKLAHAIGLKVVAEGVESDEQCRLLVELGCDQLQGYLIAHPLNEESVVQLIHKSSNRSRQKSNILPFSSVQ